MDTLYLYNSIWFVKKSRFIHIGNETEFSKTRIQPRQRGLLWVKKKLITRGILGKAGWEGNFNISKEKNKFYDKPQETPF